MKKSKFLLLLPVVLTLPLSGCLPGSSAPVGPDDGSNGIGKVPESVIGKTYTPPPPVPVADLKKAVQKVSGVIATPPKMSAPVRGKVTRKNVAYFINKYSYAAVSHATELDREISRVQLLTTDVYDGSQSTKGFPKKATMDALIKQGKVVSSHSNVFRNDLSDCRFYTETYTRTKGLPECYVKAKKKYEAAYKKDAAKLNKMAAPFGPATKKANKSKAKTASATAKPAVQKS